MHMDLVTSHTIIAAALFLGSALCVSRKEYGWAIVFGWLAVIAVPT